MSLYDLNIQELYPVEFTSGFDHRLQQEDSRIWECAMKCNFQGKSKLLQKFGESKANKIVSRKSDTVYSKEEYEQVEITACPFDITHCFDENDDELLGTIGLPDNAAVMSQAYAYARQKDQVFLQALGGTAYGGPDGKYECPLPASQKVAVDYQKDGTTGVNTGMTYDKILRALAILGKNEAFNKHNMGMGAPKLVINQCAMSQLMCEPFFINNDYTANRPIDEGYMGKALGVEIYQTELIPCDTINDIARAYLWVPQAMITTCKRERRTRFDILPEKRHTIQIRTDFFIGASRYYDEGVVEICFDQSPTPTLTA